MERDTPELGERFACSAKNVILTALRRGHLLTHFQHECKLLQQENSYAGPSLYHFKAQYFNLFGRKAKN
jgi:hypothetical protein